MKKIIVAAALVFLFASIQVYSQDKNSGILPGFWSIPWGTERLEVIGLLAEKDLPLTKETKDEISVQATFGGKPAYLFFGFYQDKLFGGMVRYFLTSSTLLDDYRNVVELITSKYGKSSMNEEKYESLISNEDRHKEQAIENGRATISTTWVFSDGNALICYINKENQEVTIVYAEDEMSKLYASEQNAKKMSDF